MPSAPPRSPPATYGRAANAAETAAGLHHAPAESVTREPAIDPNCQSLLDHEREEKEEHERRRARRDEALARQRAYGRNADTPPTPIEETPHTDIEV